MKRNSIGMLSAALACVLALSACGAASTAETKAETANLAANAAGMPEASSGVVTAAAVSDSGVSEEAFSNRDLAGTYDAAEAAAIRLNGTSASCASDSVTIDGSTVTITAAGTYVITGELADGTVVVDAGQEDKVQLVLENASITSSDFAAIYVLQADKVFVTVPEGTASTLANGGALTQIDGNKVDGVIFSKDDLTLNGAGTLTVTSAAMNGVVSKDDLALAGLTLNVTVSGHALEGKDSVSAAGGSYTLTAGKDGIHADNDEDPEKGGVYIAGGSFDIKAGDDGIHAVTLAQIDGGTFEITAAEGIEGTCVRINGGTILIQASDDGINAAWKSSAMTPVVEISGGEIRIMMGAGDTDGVDSNGDLVITGGTVDVTGNSTFDVDGSVTFTGGTVIVNGQQVNTIPNQMMGGRGGMMGGRGNMGNNGTGNAFPERGQRGSADGAVPGGDFSSRGGRGMRGPSGEADAGAQDRPETDLDGTSGATPKSALYAA